MSFVKYYYVWLVGSKNLNIPVTIIIIIIIYISLFSVPVLLEKQKNRFVVRFLFHENVDYSRYWDVSVNFGYLSQVRLDFNPVDLTAT